MKTSYKSVASCAVAGLLLGIAGTNTNAGPFILAGTDADDHGSNAGGVNNDGWFFMQRALENLAPNVTNTKKIVAVLGSSAGRALDAANSAFDLSNLPGAGWTRISVDGAANLTSFFDGSAATDINDVGLIMMDSDGNVGGGTDAAELAVFTAEATTINNFLGSGGGLFSQSNNYGWVAALVPGISAPGESNTGINLTPAGNAAFPGLSNADLSAGPYHNRFENFGSLPVLGVSSLTGNAIILGAQGGTVINPTPPGVPDTGSLVPVLAAVAGLMMAARKRS